MSTEATGPGASRAKIENPEHEESRERQDGRDDLIFRKGRNERAESEQRTTQAAGLRHSRRASTRQGGAGSLWRYMKIRKTSVGSNMIDEERERGEKFSQHYIGLFEGRGHQQFHGAALALFGEDAHGQHWDDEQNQSGMKPEKGAQHFAR